VLKVNIADLVSVFAQYNGQPVLRVGARDEGQFALTLVDDMEPIAPILAAVRKLAERVESASKVVARRQWSKSRGAWIYSYSDLI